MENLPDNEIEQLKTRLQRMRSETKVTAIGFLIGFAATLYLAVPHIPQVFHADTVTLLKLACVGCALGGALFGVLTALIFRARTFALQRRSQHERMMQELLSSQKNHGVK